MRLPKISLSSLQALAIVAVVCLTAATASADVLKIVVNDTIHPIVAEHIDRAIQEAQRTHADALLIELRTPGGLMTSMEDIIQKILASPVPVVIYVSPAGSDASSAGFFILESADVAAMSPGTNTGAAHPVRGDGVAMDPVMKEKLENYAAALMRSYTGKRGRNVEVAESAVRQSKSFTADEALTQHLVDYIAADENDLFRQMDGKSINRFNGSKVVLHLAGKPVRLYQMTLKENILSWLMNPNFTFLIFAIGMMAIYVEFNHPGAVIPGVVGFIFVLLALFAFHILPTNYAAVVMIFGAFILFALEAKFHSHGVLTLGGIAIMVLGSLLLVDGPIPQMRVKLITSLSVAVPLGLITAFLMSIALRARRNKVLTGPQGMIGLVGIARSELAPAGTVFVQGELWNAVAPSAVNAGEPVVIRKVENLTLHVERAPEPAMRS
ncbi:MAG TPA: nodulation protein NfeD [Candidatus Angelobacter sp.]|nr:nodulation protein NfeD [Candidatus Angelobacter sp.]